MDAAFEGDVEVGVGEVEGGADLVAGLGVVVEPGPNHHVVFVQLVVVEDTPAGGVFVVAVERAVDVVGFVVVVLLLLEVLVEFLAGAQSTVAALGGRGRVDGHHSEDILKLR